MNIHLARHYGLCFGVRDAIETASTLAQKHPVTLLGELVHNPVVQEGLARMGVGTDSIEHSLASPDARTTYIITAHGTSDTLRQKLRGDGRRITDTTCPLVRRAHDRLRGLVEQGHFPVVIGKRDHVEVLGLVGDFPGAFVLEQPGQIADLPSHTSYGVISQTTQPLPKVLALVEIIRSARPQSAVHFVDTVCQPTKDRQESLAQLCAKSDLVLVIGGRNSNNTRQLVETAQRFGTRAIQIERAEEILPEWFHPRINVGVTAGTSTPDSTVGEVMAILQHIAERLQSNPGQSRAA